MIDSQRDKRKIITYGPEALWDFDIFAYEWIDNLCFTIDPSECLDNSDEYIAIARERFLKDGWYGDGAIELMWVPSFLLNDMRENEYTVGVTVWHVKQREDGISWILHPKDMFDKLLKR